MTGAVGTRAKIVLLIWALVAMLLAGHLSVSLEKNYLEHHPYFFDAVSYSFYNAKLYQRVQEVGQGLVILEEISNNNRHPLRTVPLLLFAPSLLAHPFGHLATALPCLFVFVLLLALTIYKKTSSLIPSIAGSATIALLPGIYNPVSGIAAYWLDLSAALLAGSAVLALLNSNNARDIQWLVWFVVLAACATFARYVSFAYLAFVSAPIFLFYIVNLARREGVWSRSVLLPLLVVAGSGTVIAGPYLLAHVESVSEFYRLYGYALDAPIEISIHAMQASFKEFMGSAGIMITIGLVIAWLLRIAIEKKRAASILLTPAWLALAIPIFLIFVLKTSATHTIAYAVILLLVAMSFLWTPITRDSRSSFSHTVSVILLLILGAGWAGYYAGEWKKSSNPSQEAIEAKVLQTQLADKLSHYGHKVVWNAYFDEVSWIPSLDAFYRYGRLPLPLGQDYVFSIHETVYRGNYPGWDITRINEALLKNANSWLDVAVVFDDPGGADRYLTNEFSRNAARYLAESIRKDSHWIKEFVINTQRYGCLSGYRNLRARTDNYSLVLAGRANLRPDAALSDIKSKLE